MKKVDKIILGAGLYGLYSALFSAQRGQKVVVFEYDKAAFSRATYINQARVHNGYHYPRSFSTAVGSKKYFEKFNKDFGFCVKKDFDKIYATSFKFSWTNSKQFEDFCRAAEIPCEEISSTKYFQKGACDGVFKTEEYTYDALLLKDFFLTQLKKLDTCEIIYEAKIKEVIRSSHTYTLHLHGGGSWETGFVLNTTYGSVNQILNLFGFTPFKIKYEICEIALCKVSDNIKNVGITLMDGPFFSLMPFGKSGYHSLTSVSFTPHRTSHSDFPSFSCQDEKVKCDPNQLENCNFCVNRPTSSWSSMKQLAMKYLNTNISLQYHKSMYAIKPILVTSEIDDSRPTIIKQFSDSPDFFAVLSGKINTVYDLNEILL